VQRIRQYTVTNQENGKAMLEALEHGNLFIIPLDDQRRWYRYHHSPGGEGLVQAERSAAGGHPPRAGRSWRFSFVKCGNFEGYYPKVEYEAQLAARQRQKTEDFKKLCGERAGIESTISQGVRRTQIRYARYIGLTRTNLQETASAAAINLCRHRPADQLCSRLHPARPKPHATGQHDRGWAPRGCSRGDYECLDCGYNRAVNPA